MDNQNFQKGNIFLIIAIIVGVFTIGAIGFASWKYFEDDSNDKNILKNEIAKPPIEKETGKCASIQSISEKNQCWADLAKEEKDENYCKKISTDFPETRGDCYTELAILKDDSLICEKIDSGSLHKSCLEYFEENNEKDETADWKTYQNKEYGYEIKYPKDWKLLKSLNQYSFSFGQEKNIGTPGYDGEWFIFVFNKSEKTAKNIIKDMGDQFGKDRKEKRENITINNIPALKVLVTTSTISDWYYEAIIIEQQEKIYWIHNGAIKNALFDKFYNSFKFTESNEISDWKSYENKEYGFEMKYPENFFTEQVLQPKTEVMQCDYANFINNCPTKIITVNDIPFCLQETSSAAAGTAYATYNYTAIRNKECFVISFTVPYPNCSNYLPINNQEIQKAYDKCILDNEITKPKIINQIVSTFKFTE